MPGRRGLGGISLDQVAHGIMGLWYKKGFTNECVFIVKGHRGVARYDNRGGFFHDNLRG
jgi:hypothetical protein